MIDNHCLIYNVLNFKNHKDNIISLIKKIPNNPLNMEKDGCVSHTDWNLPKEMQRDYKDYFVNNIWENFASNFCKNLKNGNVALSHIWFQIYKKNDSHGLHNHGRSHFTNVFYLKLNDRSLQTEITLPGNKKLNFKVNEGDIISFPAYYWHRSPPNKTDEEKIIISFNTDIA
jgi:hypothetical protein